MQIVWNIITFKIVKTTSKIHLSGPSNIQLYTWHITDIFVIEKCFYCRLTQCRMLPPFIKSVINETAIQYFVHNRHALFSISYVISTNTCTEIIRPEHMYKFSANITKWFPLSFTSVSCSEGPKGRWWSGREHSGSTLYNITTTDPS